MFNSDFDSVSLPNKKPGLIFAEQNCLVQTSVLLKTKRAKLSTKRHLVTKLGIKITLQ